MTGWESMCISSRLPSCYETRERVLKAGDGSKPEREAGLMVGVEGGRLMHEETAVILLH